MEKKVFEEIFVKIIPVKSERVLTDSFNGDYGGGIWNEDENEE